MPKTHVAGQVALIPCLYGGYPVDRTIWKHNGSDIETKKNKSRFKVLPNGTLQIDNIKPETDKGLYSCFVSNRKSEKASGTVSINVLRRFNLFSRSITCRVLKYICICIRAFAQNEVLVLLTFATHYNRVGAVGTQFLFKLQDLL